MASPALRKIHERLAAVVPSYFQALFPTPDIARARQIIHNVLTSGVMPDNVAATPVAASGVACEWLVPVGADPGNRLLYLHGGGYIAGDLDTFRGFAAHVAKACNCCVLNAAYRLAPENPPGAPREDALTAYRWMLAHGPGSKAPARRAFVAGDSAGGGLAILMMSALLAAGERLPDAAVTLSGAMDLSDMPTLPVEQRPVFQALMRLFHKDLDPRDPAVSPIYGNLRGLPPVLMQVGGAEDAMVQNVRFEERARAAGVAARLEIWPEMPHDFQLFVPELPEAEAAVAKIGEFVRGFL
jgi:monoterpene epsilon-lactone hydrolase